MDIPKFNVIFLIQLIYPNTLPCQVVFDVLVINVNHNFYHLNISYIEDQYYWYTGIGMMSCLHYIAWATDILDMVGFVCLITWFKYILKAIG